jgi:O-antigen/teichoic acid export membrane protein
MLKDMGLSYPTVQRAEIDFDQISTLFWVNLGMSVLLVAVMVIIAPALSWFYRDPRLTLIAMVTAVTGYSVVNYFSKNLDNLVKLSLGSQWTGASRIVFFLGIAACFQPVLNTMGWLFLSQGRSREMLQWAM